MEGRRKVQPQVYVSKEVGPASLSEEARSKGHEANKRPETNLMRTFEDRALTGKFFNLAFWRKDRSTANL